MRRIILSLFFVFCLSACNSSKVKDAIEVVEGVERRTIDTTRLGINAFANDSRFGSISAQYREVRDVLGLRFVRVLFGWNSAVQPSPGSSPDFSFYDEIMDAIPNGVDALIIVNGLPDWMSNSANWINGDPRETFHELWVKPVVSRYGGRGRVIGFQIWNEPNMTSNPENGILGFADAANYVEVVARASNYINDTAPSKRVVNAATTAINQNFPETLDYNRAMRDAGMIDMIDVYAFHYYGMQFENVIQSGGVADYLNSVSRPLWISESGAQGVNSQLEYGETVWPFLREKIPGITRIYVYQFTEGVGPNDSFGLKNASVDAPVTDLYVHLSDRAAE